MLACGICQDLQLNPHPSGLFGEHGVPFSNLDEAAENGCSSCAILRDGILPFTSTKDGMKVRAFEYIETRDDEMLGHRWPLPLELLSNGNTTRLEVYAEGKFVRH